jgi:LacI family transcriptional regulator
MKIEAITIKDIAKALNLSTSTVSRALRGSYEISAETKKLVLDYAEKMNYRPNPIALSLKEQRSRAIGIVVPEIANNFFSQAINGIESIAYNKAYHVIITQSHESAEREGTNISHLVSRSVDGLLISLASETTDLTYLKGLHEKGLPVVFFDRITDEIDTHKVTANNYKGAFTATEHLIRQGYTTIAHITNSPVLSITRERLRGYRDALEKNGLTYNEALVKYCEHAGMVESEVEEAVQQLFSLPQQPDAVFTVSDRVTTSYLSVARNIPHLPAHTGLVGFTNAAFAHLFEVPVSVIKQPAFQIGQAAIEMLISMIESKRPVTDYETRVLDTEMIVRASSQKG